MPTFGSLFAGIGGLDCGLERAGWEVKWQVESDRYCTRVLEKHWPDVRRYGAIKEVDWREVEPVELVCGGFPCQPVSVAGKQLGEEDARWLWPEFERCLRVLRPRFALIENVPGLLVRGGSRVLADLAACGYDAEWDSLPAAAFGAPHLRYRVFIVAHRSRDAEGWAGEESGTERQRVGAGGESGDVADAASLRCDWTGTEPRSKSEAKAERRLLESSGSGDAAYPERPILRHQPRRRHGQDGTDQTKPRNNGPQGAVADAENDRRPRPRSAAQQGEPAVDQRGEAGDVPISDALRCFRRKNHQGQGQTGRDWIAPSDWWLTEPEVGRVAHGVPARVDRLRALGNAVVPQVAEWIGRRILEASESS